MRGRGISPDAWVYNALLRVSLRVRPVLCVPLQVLPSLLSLPSEDSLSSALSCRMHAVWLDLQMLSVYCLSCCVLVCRPQTCST